MLRNDGEYSIYYIEHKWNNESDWTGSIENQYYFTPSMECWLKLGIHGTFDLEEAKIALNKCIDMYKEIQPFREFRLVNYKINQSKSVVKI